MNDKNQTLGCCSSDEAEYYQETQDTKRDASKTYFIKGTGYREAVDSDFNEDGSFKLDVTYYEKSNTKAQCKGGGGCCGGGGGCCGKKCQAEKSSLKSEISPIKSAIPSIQAAAAACTAPEQVGALAAQVVALATQVMSLASALDSRI